MFLFGGGANIQCKKKKKKPQQWGNQGWGNNLGWENQGNQGWGGNQGNQGWGGNQGNQGWGGNQGNQGWGGNQGNQGWGGNQGNQGWGGNQGNNGWENQENNNFGFQHNQDFWGNNLQGGDWVEEQKKKNEYNIFQPGQQELDINDLLEQQIVFLEPSPAKQKLDELRQLGQPFEDELYPPNEQSLSGEYGPQGSWSNIQWGKITESMPDGKIFQGKIQPGDIKQGYLGDCYFLAGLAALAERPDRIFNLFLLEEINELKYFSVKMLFKGKWMTIDMDEWVPYLYGKPAFTKANENEFWVILLEKAWAKLYTSYKRIEAGYPEQALHDLTGAPIKKLYFQHSSFDKERDWQYLVMASQKEFAMCASSQPGSDTNKSTSGVVQGHAYTVLNAIVINVGGQRERIVQLRNPWGKGEFHGKWSDGDQTWEYVDESEKERVGYNPDKDDGIFFMTYDDFLAQFRAMTVAEIDDDASYVYKSAKDPENKGVYFRVTVPSNGNYSFQMDKTPERIYPDQYQSAFRYPLSHIELGKLQGEVCHRMQGFKSSRRTLIKKADCTPGVYIVWCQIHYSAQFQKDFDVNLAIYSEYACNVEFASHEQAVIFTGDPNVEWEPPQQENNKPWNNMGNNEYEGNGWDLGEVEQPEEEGGWEFW